MFKAFMEVFDKNKIIANTVIFKYLWKKDEIHFFKEVLAGPY